MLAAHSRAGAEMAVQLFILRGVPDDEADAVRALLERNGIDYYETPAGHWGVSMPALWLDDEHQLERARALIDGYQRRRLETARAEHAQRKRDGTRRTLFDEVRARPLQTAVYTAIIVAVLYFSTKPFIVDLAR